jgi:peptidoglycan/xylan/chitin deacetylase (PgdA/CDA1 family)
MNWFRVPYGDQNLDVLDIAHRFGLSSIQWIVDTHDWKKTSSISDIKNTINDYSNPGVILMHDGSLTNTNFIHPNENPSRQNTVNALQPIINFLKNRGFNFVPLSKAFK